MIFRLFSPNLRNFFARLPCAPRRGKTACVSICSAARMLVCANAQKRQKSAPHKKTDENMRLRAGF